MDFFVVPTIGFRILYGFVIVRLHRRDLVWINHNQPNSGMGCTPGHRGFSLGGGSALYDQGPRSDLRHCCHTPIARHGHPGQAYRTGFTLAEWLCRAVDRIDPARVLGPHHCLQRGASAPDSKIIRRLLQLRQNASVFAQGCANFPSDSSNRNHSFTPDPRRAHHHYVRV
jgi:hypothetical protein